MFYMEIQLLSPPYKNAAQIFIGIAMILLLNSWSTDIFIMSGFQSMTMLRLYHFRAFVLFSNVL